MKEDFPGMRRLFVDPFIALVLLILLIVLDGTVMPLLVRYSRVREVETMYNSTAIVFLNEISKLNICLFVLFYFVEKSTSDYFQSLSDTLFSNPKESIKVCIPSLIYTVQNNLYYVALSNLDASTYCVTSQLKILTTAVFFVWIMGKMLSKVQWSSLVLLMAGVSLVQLYQPAATAQSNQKALDGDQNRLLGLFAVITSCFTSGFAGVYFEKVLKGSQLTIWHQNVRLSMLGIPLSLLAMLIKDWDAVSTGEIFDGIDWLVGLIIFLNASGGLIIAMVVKYANNVMKAFGQSGAIVLAVTVTFSLARKFPDPMFIFGTLTVILSVYLYAKFPPSSPSLPTTPSSTSPSKAATIIIHDDDNKRPKTDSNLTANDPKLIPEDDDRININNNCNYSNKSSAHRIIDDKNRNSAVHLLETGNHPRALSSLTPSTIHNKLSETTASSEQQEGGDEKRLIILDL